jgi:threonine/homoserine/homoserine lactone efflux protein
LSIFFFAFLPQFFATNDAHRLVHMLELSTVFMLVTFVVFVCYDLAASWVRHHVISRQRVLAWMRRTFATAFVGRRQARLRRALTVYPRRRLRRVSDAPEAAWLTFVRS